MYIHYNLQAHAGAHFRGVGEHGERLQEGDLNSAIQLYQKASPTRLVDALSNLAAAYMQRCTQRRSMPTSARSRSTPTADSQCRSATCSSIRRPGAAVLYQRDSAAARLCDRLEQLAGACKDDGDVQRYRVLRGRCGCSRRWRTRGQPRQRAQGGGLLQGDSRVSPTFRHRSDFAIALGNLASVYYEKRELPLAVETIAAPSRSAQLPHAYNNLGNALKELGGGRAIDAYRTSLRLKPDHQHAYNNLGNAMKDKGRLDESLLCYQTAIRICPTFAAAHSNLASLLKDKGGVHLQQALMHYLEAIRIDPYFADAYSNLGNAYRDLGNMEEAIRMHQAAAALKPNYAEVHSHLASTYKDVGRIPEAIVCYRKALQLNPWLPDALCTLIHTVQLTCEWTDHAANMRMLETCLDRQLADGVCPSMQPFHAFMYPIPLLKVKRLAQAYAMRAVECAKALDAPPFVHPPLDASLGATPGGARLRVGYLSSDFCNHPLGHLMQSVFGMHDASRLEVWCYSLRQHDGSAYRFTIERGASHFREVSHLDLQRGGRSTPTASW